MSTAFSQNVINKALKEKPWVTKRRNNKYRVVPRKPRHGKYELEVSWDEEGNPTVESCIDYRTKEECLGFKFNGGRCYHAAKLLIHLMK